MSFLTGLVTGAAQSISGNLQAALDRRQEELSRARQFWRTRQAQKADLADAHDRRASKALNRFINEFDGNIAKGLAAYKAVGGDVDAAEAYIKNLDDTRMVGLDYDINEKFKFDNIDLEQFADLSRKDALGSISMDVKPIPASAFKDTSNLGKIGLGLKDTSKYADEVNKLTPPRVNKAIEGLELATFDPSGTKSAMQFQMDKQKFEMQMKANSLDIKNQVKFNILELNKLGDSPEDENKRQLLLRDNEALIKTYDTFAAIDKRGQGGVTTSGMLSLYNSRMEKLKSDSQYGRVADEASVVDNTGKVLTGQDAINYYAKLKAESDAQYVEQVLMNEEGAFRNAKAEDMVSFLGFSNDIVEQAIKNINIRMGKTKEEKTEGSSVGITDTDTLDAMSEASSNTAGKITVGPIEVGEAEKNKEYIKTNPKAYVDDLIENQAGGDILNVDFEALTNQLQQAGVETATITEVLAPYYENRFSKSEEQSAENQQQIKQLTKQKIDQLLKLGLRDLNPVDGSVPPRPASQGGRNKNQDRWDSMYGATHFPDGSMK